MDVERALPLNTARKAGLLAPEDGAPEAPYPAGPSLGYELPRAGYALPAHARRAHFPVHRAPRAPALCVFGAAYGAAAGPRGRADAVLMRLADFVVALPFLLFRSFSALPAAWVGKAASRPFSLPWCCCFGPATRLVGANSLIREEGYVQAARLLGALAYLIFRHMIPNTLGVILVTLTFAIPTAIFTEAFLSFIGMGVAPHALLGLHVL